MLIPAMAAHQKNAQKIINYYYDPANAAEVAAYVQYITPVKGAKEAIAKIDPTLVENQLIFPTERDAVPGQDLHAARACSADEVRADLPAAHR